MPTTRFDGRRRGTIAENWTGRTSAVIYREACMKGLPAYEYKVRKQQVTRDLGSSILVRDG